MWARVGGGTVCGLELVVNQCGLELVVDQCGVELVVEQCVG